jgi:transposase
MASITKKMIRGNAYYYARECKRVEGKPKIVWQKYLGRLEDIIAAVESRSAEAAPTVPAPQSAVISEFGAVAALYDLARRLDLVGLIDRHVPKQRTGPSVGTYLLVAALNRCVAPTSKAGMSEWFQETALRRLLPIEAKQLTSQRFWDNMDRVPQEKIAAIESELTSHMVREFAIDIRQVLFDATNFFTFIDTFNERSTLARRGKSKEGRAALRIVGLALLVSADFHVPLLHRTYPGNQPDAKTFGSLTADLVSRYREVAAGAEHVTIVFDKGNNSQDNLDAVLASPFHFVGSLVPTQHPDLLEIPAAQFRSLANDGFPGVTAHRTTLEVFGVSRTVLVTFNENLFVSQSQTLLREIAKRQRHLAELQEQLRKRRSGEVRGGKPPTTAGVKKKVDAWLKARHMQELFRVEIAETGGLPELTYQFDADAWDVLQRTLLGKTILFTDNGDWTDAEIVHAYRSQHHVETAFRCLKDPHHISIRPQHHWTDQKVEVHVFTCVLALLLCSLLRKEAHRHGIDRSIPELLDGLGRIREVVVTYPQQEGKQTPAVAVTLSQMNGEQQELYDALGLERYRAS